MKRNRWYWRRTKNKWPNRQRYGVIHRFMPMRGGMIALAPDGIYDVQSSGAFTSISVRTGNAAVGLELFS